MVRLQLDERQWKKLEVALAAEKRRGRPGRDDRNFMEAALLACLTLENRAGSCPRRARAWHAPQTLAYYPQNTADGDSRTVGHGHGHGHVYAESAAFRDTR